MPRTSGELRAAFAEAVAKERRDVRVAAVLLTLLTAAGVLLLATALAVESARGGRLFAALAGLALAAVYVLFVVSNDTERGDRAWVVAAGVALAGLGVLALTPLPGAAPSLFWILYAAGTVGAFGALGMAYRWRDPYLGLTWGHHRYDDPSTLRDDRDRAHLALTQVVALPRLLVGGFADLAGRGWMRQALEPEDVEAAVGLLERLAVHDRADVDRLLRPRAVLWLTRMGLLHRGEIGWALTPAGEELAGTRGMR
jgi:hypothetical protein